MPCCKALHACLHKLLHIKLGFKTKASDRILPCAKTLSIFFLSFTMRQGPLSQVLSQKIHVGLSRVLLPPSRGSPRPLVKMSLPVLSAPRSRHESASRTRPVHSAEDVRGRGAAASEFSGGSWRVASTSASGDRIMGQEIELVIYLSCHPVLRFARQEQPQPAAAVSSFERQCHGQRKARCSSSTTQPPPGLPNQRRLRIRIQVHASPLWKIYLRTFF